MPINLRQKTFSIILSVSNQINHSVFSSCLPPHKFRCCEDNYSSIKSFSHSISPLDSLFLSGKSLATVPFCPLSNTRCSRPPKGSSVIHTGSRLRRKDSTVIFAEEVEIICVGVSKLGRSFL